MEKVNKNDKSLPILTKKPNKIKLQQLTNIRNESGETSLTILQTLKP